MPAAQRIDIDERARGEPLQAVREHVVEDLGLAPGQDRLPGARGVQRRHEAQWVVPDRPGHGIEFQERVWATYRTA